MSSQTPNENKTYVYGSTEIKLTGRTAVRKIERKSRRSGGTTERSDTVYEITPANPDMGSWTRWVRIEELYEIEKEEGEESSGSKVS